MHYGLRYIMKKYNEKVSFVLLFERSEDIGGL